MTKTITDAKGSQPSARKAQHTLPPSSPREIRRMVRRARKVMAFYCDLAKDEADYMMGDLLSDLMHLCDRDQWWGSFEDRLSSGYMHHHAEAYGE